MAIEIGSIAEYSFTVTAEEMELFASLSNDRSSVHSDPIFARSRGFEDVIVYGGIILAKLSHVLGGKIPGDTGVSTHWQITYRKPLYVGQEAMIQLEVVGVSPSTGLIDGKFKVLTAGQVIAVGKTQSLVPREMIAEA